jgi:hypothetical protein
MSHFDLTPVETRILGCLLEKERVTPENYPLSLNSLVAACNQSTNRDPVVAYEERTVEEGIAGLREKKLATMIHSAGSRVSKYRHNLPDHYDLATREVALLCVLLLRGPQTPGELRIRTERMHPFGSIEEVEGTLSSLAAGGDPLVRVLPPRPGQKERRYVQLLAGEPTAGEVVTAAPSFNPDVPRIPSSSQRLEIVEAELASVKTELHQLREELAAFRRQFE